MTPVYKPYEKASFLAPANEIHHLHAVMNDPCDQHQVMVVNITSTKPDKYHDPACVLYAGEHPFIQHESYVLYRRADTVRATYVGKMVDLNYYIAREDWDPAVFARIVAGIRLSDDIAPRIVRYADDNNIV